MFTHIRDFHSSAQVPMETFRSQLFLAVLNKGAVEAMDSGQEITKLWFCPKMDWMGPPKKMDRILITKSSNHRETAAFKDASLDAWEGEAPRSFV